jgi:hypothetical protein
LVLFKSGRRGSSEEEILGDRNERR